MGRKNSLRVLLAKRELVVAPGVYSGLTAKLAEAAGFRALYLGGGSMGYIKCGTEANLSLTEMAQAGIEIRTVCPLPLILDGACGWGDPMHIHRTIGMTEGAARELYGDSLRIYHASFVPMYHAMTARKRRAEMKLVCAGPDERIVGLHVIGAGADEMLQGFAVALRMGARKSDFDDTVAIHPTSAEEFVTMRQQPA